MSFIRNSTRKTKSAVEIDAIKRVMNKYVDFKDLYLKSDFHSDQVEFLARLEDDSLVLRFNEPLKEDQAEVFTIVHERFIDFEMELVSPAGPEYPANSYVMRVLKCDIALEKREHERFAFNGKRPAVSDIATIKVKERESDFQKSLSVKMIMEEYIGRLDGIDFKKAIFKDEKEIPPTVRYVIESGEKLYIKDLAGSDDFFTTNEKFFEETNSADLRDDLRHWIQNNVTSMKSVLVLPITYYPLVGEEFAIGYIVAANKDDVIGEDTIARVDTFIRSLSERIRNGNLIESKTGGTIVDVSAGGARIELTDSKLVDKLSSQNVIIFEMNFKEKNPLLISGRIVYIYSRDGGSYYVGVDFRGSRFGPQIKSVLPIHIEHFLKHEKGILQ